MRMIKMKVRMMKMTMKNAAGKRMTNMKMKTMSTMT